MFQGLWIRGFRVLGFKGLWIYGFRVLGLKA